MTIRQLLYAMILGLALWAAVLGFGWAAYSCVGDAHADPSPTRPATFKTPLEADLWAALATCRGELEVAERRHAGEVLVLERELAGARAKVRTTTTTIQLACPAPLPCPTPPAPDCSIWTPGTIGGGIGLLGGFLLCGALKSGSPDVVIAR